MWLGPARTAAVRAAGSEDGPYGRTARGTDKRLQAIDLSGV
ncbi:MAG: hypothetical protein QXU93_05500 [Thermoproteus sp.]